MSTSNSIIPFASNQLSMSSREIAELTGKQHSNVNRDIRSMLSKIDDSNLNHEQYQEVKDERGYTSEFLLNKDLTLTLMLGYDVQARFKVVKRWQELESGVKKIRKPRKPTRRELELELQNDKLRIELLELKLQHANSQLEHKPEPEQKIVYIHKSDDHFSSTGYQKD